MNNFKKHNLLLGLVMTVLTLPAQVQLRDTVVSWQHHKFTLNADYSMNWHTTNDSEIEEVQFPNSKVIENELIRLVVVPEYGARVLSFVYKPTGYEYLYQSACGSPYGMNGGSFYYDWLMVWGGIFPTFPESEHGKTWLLPWTYEVLKNNSDTVSIRMSYTDTASCPKAPSKFNNGTTQITCIVDVSVYKASSVWDFDIKLVNNKNEEVIYEYWTCTTLTPGSEIGNTGSPLNSEMVVPFNKYKADWSPNNWIGKSGTLYDYTKINYLSKWNDMGIAYAHELSDNYWGVINHNNDEGIMRLSENVETPGMKFWTWGKNNINNNMFDFSNGGRDNYIELWAGVSGKFFEDAKLYPLQEKSWKESYCATTGLSGIIKINNTAAANLLWNGNENELTYELNIFRPFDKYSVKLSLNDSENTVITEKEIEVNTTGNTETFSLTDMGITLPDGLYIAILEVSNLQETVLTANKEMQITNPSTAVFADNSNKIQFKAIGNNQLRIENPNQVHQILNIYSIEGKQIVKRFITSNSEIVQLPAKGLYIIQCTNRNLAVSNKVYIY